MNRIGLAAGYDSFMSVQEIAGWMKQADERGFEIGFFSETIELMREAIAEAFAEPGLEEALDALFFIGVTVLPKDQYYELIDFERKAVRLGYPKLQ